MEPREEKLRTSDGVQLRALRWIPNQPRADLFVVHGYGEHIGRYGELAAYIAERGVAVHGIDLRGHGKSEGVRGFVENFRDYFADLDALLSTESTRPRWLLGHSMGGLITTRYLTDGRGGALKGFLLSSPFFALKLKVNPIKKWVGNAFAEILPKLALPTGLHGSDVCRDPELQRLYDTDPLNLTKATTRWFAEAQRAQAAAFAEAAKVTLPCLVMQGGDDRVADAEATRTLFERFTSVDKTLRMLDGHFHEIFNERPETRTQVFSDVASWIERRL